MIVQKIISVLMVVLTVPIILLDGDATLTIFMLILSLPVFFSKKEWFY